MHFAFGISDFDEKRYLVTMLLGKGVMVAMMALFGQSLVSAMKNPFYLVLAIAIWAECTLPASTSVKSTRSIESAQSCR